MSRHLLPWAVLILVGVVIAATQLGDGLIVQRAEARVPLFLGGSVVAVAGLLKLIAVATDPELKREEDEGRKD